MQNDIASILHGLSDGALIAQIKTLIGRERHLTAEVVAHLAELDTRDVYLREGYASLHVYCRDALGLSDGEAYNRIEVARAARRFPVILGMLAEGSLSLTAARLLAPHLTPENHREVLESARGKTRAEIEKIVARLSPRPDVPFSVRRVGDSSVAGTGVDKPGVALQNEMPSIAEQPSADGAPSGITSSSPPARAVTALSPDRYKLQLTITGDTLEKLRLAQDMLSHALPSADQASIVDRALTALLTELARKKFADTLRPRRAAAPRPLSGPTRSIRQDPARAPSAAVKRTVWVRDLGRCAFVGAGGHRCDERRFVEFHHVDPYALGGEATVDNIQLRCRPHNDYEGRLYFGDRRAKRQLVPEQVGSSTGGSIEAAN